MAWRATPFNQDKLNRKRARAVVACYSLMAKGEVPDFNNVAPLAKIPRPSLYTLYANADDMIKAAAWARSVDDIKNMREHMEGQPKRLRTFAALAMLYHLMRRPKLHMALLSLPNYRLALLDEVSAILACPREASAAAVGALLMIALTSGGDRKQTELAVSSALRAAGCRAHAPA